MAMQARSSKELLAKLRQRTLDNLHLAEELNSLPEEQLRSRPTAKAWSALECIAHLNHYGAYYIPEITQRIAASKQSAEDTFTSSRLGNYFSVSMKPGPQIKKIKTFKSADPQNFTSAVNRQELQTFINDQQRILELLDQASKVSLTKTKTGISITKLIRLRLGDTFRVVVYHNWRHLEQAQRAAGV